MNRLHRLRQGRSAQGGFTLIELTVSIFLLAILATIAIPSLQRIIESQRLRSTAFGLVSDLTLARSEAVKRGATVELAPIGDNWADGWQVRVVSSSETIGQQTALGAGISLSSTVTAIRFTARGQVSTASSIRLALSDSHDGRRCISLDPSGRPKSTKAACPA